MTLENKGLGAFALHDKLGVGGMGEVWRATHRRSGTEVAVKLSYARRADEDAGRIVLNEARVMAGVDHPNIVRILALGDVGPEGANYGLRGDDLFIAMEYASGGALSSDAVRSWPELRDLILQVLDGLAHTHAREIVHLDLKPENIVRFPRSGETWRYGITDFGIAGTPETFSDRGSISGTLLYMSPEQVHGHWRDYGPWTDLYAVGGVIWQLLHGDAPFRRNSPVLTAMANAQAELPAFEPRFAVPSALDRWLRIMLAKTPRGRFRNAADAAAALHAFPADPSEPVVHQANPATTLASIEETVRSVAPETLLVHGLLAPEQGAALEVDAEPEITSPPTEAWNTDYRPTDRLSDAGLRLFAFRERPIIGRLPERAALWDAYLEARAQNAAVAIAVTGEADSGKSRLTRWFAARLRELGQAEVFTVRHGEHVSWQGALQDALDRFFRISGLEEGEERTARVRARLGAVDEAVAERLVRLTTACDTFDSAFEVFAVLDEFVELLGQRRPAVLLFEDVEEHGFALEFAEHAKSALNVAACIVVSADPERARPAVRRRLEEFHGERVSLGPIAPALRRDIVESLIPLAEASVDTLVAIGAPTLAHQHIAAWIESNELVSTDSGFDAADARRWRSLSELWEARIERTCREHGTDFEAALRGATLLAAVGTRVERSLLDVMDVDADLAAGEAVLEALAGVRPDGDDVVFLSRATASALRDIARRRGWLAAFDVALARQLADRQRADRERAAQLFARAGDVATALQAARAVVQMSFARDGEALFDWMEQLAAGREDAETRYEINLTRIRQGLSRVHSGDYDGATALFDRVSEELERQPDDELRAELDYAWATHDLYQMRYDQGLHRLEGPFAYFAATGHPVRMGENYSLRGDLYMFSGRFEQARSDYEAALAAFEEAGKEEGYGWALYRLGSLADEVGDFEGVERYLGEANAIFRRLADRNGLMLCKDILGLSAYRQGEWDLARERWTEVLEMANAADDQSRFLCHENLGRLAAQVGDPEVALRHLEVVVEQIDAHGYSMCVQWIWDAVIEAAARTGDIETARHALKRARIDADRVDMESPFTEPTCARAAEALTHGGHEVLADEVRAFASQLSG